MFRLFAIVIVLIVAVGHGVPSMAPALVSGPAGGAEQHAMATPERAPVFKPCGKLSGKRSVLCQVDHGLLDVTAKRVRPWSATRLPVRLNLHGTAHEPQVDPRPPRTA